MSIYIGNQKLGSLYLGSTKIKEAWVGDVKVYGSGDPYNPLNLPPFTIRCKFPSWYTPTIGDSQTLVDATENIWDITKNSTNWGRLFDHHDVLEVLGANTTGVTNMAQMFNGCTLLTTVSIFDTSDVTAINSIFSDCRSLTAVPLFDTSSCENMGGMFSGCTALTTVPLFDTSSCLYMGGIFRLCSNLVSVPLFDTSNVTFMSQMFDHCTSLITVPPLDTSSVTDMSYMFRDCVNVQSGALSLYQQASTQDNPPTDHAYTFTNCGYNTTTGLADLQQIPESWGGLAPEDPYNPLNLPPFTIRCKFEQGYDPRGSVYYIFDSYELVDETNNIWDLHKNSTDWSELLYYGREVIEVLGANTTGVTNMRSLFFSTPLTTIPLFDTSSCTNMNGMFENCISLTTVPLFDTSNATSMGDMFSNCYSLTSVPLFDTRSVTDMGFMFQGCRELTAIPLFDTSSCTNMQQMFDNCTSLTSIPLFDTSLCTDMNGMFTYCYNVQSGALALYQQASTQATIPNHGAWTFYNCGINTQTGLAELQQIPSSWGGLA